MSIDQANNVLTDHPDDGDSVVLDLSALANVPTAVDIIPDFEKGEGDVIDLATLLDGALISFSETAGGHDTESAIAAPEATINGAPPPLDAISFSYWGVDSGLKILYDEDLASQVDHI